MRPERTDSTAAELEGLANKSIDDLVGETTARLAALHGRGGHVGAGSEALERVCDAWDEFAHAVNCSDCPDSELAGIHWPADPDGFDPPEGWSWVERCDSCPRYPHDESAAERLNELGHGTERRYFDRETLEKRPADTECADLEGCSVAINVLAPPEGESQVPRRGPFSAPDRGADLVRGERPEHSTYH